MSNSRKGNKNQDIYTIDIKHSEMLERFNNIEEVLIPNLKREKEELKEKVKELKETELDEFMSGMKSFSELLIKYEEIHEDLRGGASEEAASEIFRLVSKIQL